MRTLRLQRATAVNLMIAFASLWAHTPFASAEVVTLSTGEKLSVRITRQDAQVITFVHPLLGEITVGRDQVIDIEPDPPDAKGAPPDDASDEDSAEPQADQPPEPALPVPAPDPAETPAAAPWKYKLVAAAAGATGNTENGDVSVIFTASRETDEIRTIFDTSYFFGQSNGDRSENRFSAGARNDWLNPKSRWFYFADARFDYDEFQSWDSRVSGHVGLGYRLIQPPKWLINLRGGIGAIKKFGSLNEDVRPEGLIGVEGKWTISDKQSITFDTTAFPSLEDAGEFRWVNNAGWSLLLDQKNKLSLTAGLQHEYQSEVDPGREKNDVRVFAGLQFDF